MGNIIGGNRNNNHGDNQDYRFASGPGLYFGDHFVMGGQEFQALDPESFLFGEMADLDYLSRMPGMMTRPPSNIKHTNATRCLLFTNKETLKLVPHISDEQNNPSVANGAMHLDFKFDSDAPCKVTVHFFAQEEIDADGGIHFKSKLTWPTYHYSEGYGQDFSQPESTIKNLDKYSDKELFYQTGSTTYPIVVHIVAETEDLKQHSLATYATFDKSNAGVYTVKPLVQKANINGLNLVLKEIFGIEKKEQNRDASEDGSNFGDVDDDDDNTECVVCMSQAKDTMALPCRHLCLCNPCADVLRFQANKCPICRAPFHSLLQIRVLKPANEVVHEDESDDEENESEHVPPGFASVSLAEAVSGRPQNRDAIVEEGYLDVEGALTTTITPPQPPSNAPTQILTIDPDTPNEFVAVGPNDQPRDVADGLMKSSYKSTTGKANLLQTGTNHTDLRGDTFGKQDQQPQHQQQQQQQRNQQQQRQQQQGETTTHGGDDAATPTTTTTTTTTTRTDSNSTKRGGKGGSKEQQTLATEAAVKDKADLRSGDLSRVNFHNYPSDERLEMGSQVVWSSRDGVESDIVLSSSDPNSFNLPGTPDQARTNTSLIKATKAKLSPEVDDKNFNTLEI